MAGTTRNSGSEKMGIYNRRYETLSREEIEQIQIEHLTNTVKRVYKNVPFYQDEMKRRNVTPKDIVKVKDLERFGFTTREDLGNNYPYGLFAVPLKDIVRINSVSGVTGKPTVLGYTKTDLGLWMELLSRLYVAAGVTADDIVQLSFVYGLANWGRSMRVAAENIEASVIPMSAMGPEKEIMIMADYKTTCVVSTPTNILHMSELLPEMGIKKKDLALKRCILVAESLSSEDRGRIEKGLGIEVSTAYGIPEAMGPGIAYECKEGRLHIAEDNFIVEVIDPKTGDVLDPGNEGELVVSTITTKAYPLIRFRTGDISRVSPGEACPCGRNLSTIEMPMKRSDDLLSVRGVKVYPSQIDKIINDNLKD
ncbi:MAG: AMP-binding protein, partial [Deltaproteobacteria bacterium]